MQRRCCLRIAAHGWVTMSKEHWLVGAAQQALNGATLPAVEIGTNVSANWAAVGAAAQLQPDMLAQAVANYFRLERANLANVDLDFARQVSESTARTSFVLPIRSEGNRAMVATADPVDSEALDSLAFALGMPVIACVAPPGEIDAKLSEVFADDSEPTELWGTMPRSLAGAELVIRRKNGPPVEAGTSGTAKLFREILRMAIHVNASDAHVQPYGTGAVVRNRVDGVLHKAIDLPRKVHDHLVRHVKAISGMDPTRSLVPQDGELAVEVDHRRTDLRLSIVPVDSGERLVLRLLPQSQVRSLATLKLDEAVSRQLYTLAHSSAGLVLVTGPTGSGKSSLMYSMLAEINTPDINIMTVEQPVEYRLRGSSQIDVDPRTGLTFALALRSILRQDPDVVMVGEIRDEETAKIASQAALTGHLVLSTVHTLDALASMSRMEDLGVSLNTLGNALRAIIAQRLVRCLCRQCRVPLTAAGNSNDERRFAALRSQPAWRVTGCDACNKTGYSGRLPVVEIIEITAELQKALLLNERHSGRLEMLAIATGTRFLPEAMADRVDNGDTTVAEAIRVYGRDFLGKLEYFTNLRKAGLAETAGRLEAGH
jgi:type IV pilus assembly protein PilB